ncbi:MAG: small multi-drug export protein [Candidatus Omnitrophica bacterium]|nr:small multi-drug export protein [Candidatus Omnitrophota bacterium]
MDWIFKFPKEVSVMIVGMLPIFELRGAIPLGFYFKLPIIKTFLLAVLGNLVPALFLLLFLKPISEYLHRFFIFKRFFNWLFERTGKRAELVQRYEALGLAIFVAIPLPMTGAWTGAIVASLFKIKFRYAFFAITIGVLIAGIIVSLLCILGKLSWQILQ